MAPLKLVVSPTMASPVQASLWQAMAALMALIFNHQAQATHLAVEVVTTAGPAAVAMGVVHQLAIHRWAATAAAHSQRTQVPRPRRLILTSRRRSLAHMATHQEHLHLDTLPLVVQVLVATAAQAIPQLPAAPPALAHTATAATAAYMANRAVRIHPWVMVAQAVAAAVCHTATAARALTLPSAAHLQAMVAQAMVEGKLATHHLAVHLVATAQACTQVLRAAALERILVQVLATHQLAATAAAAVVLHIRQAAAAAAYIHLQAVAGVADTRQQAAAARRLRHPPLAPHMVTTARPVPILPLMAAAHTQVAQLAVA
jgi:hypothetical protein